MPDISRRSPALSAQPLPAPEPPDELAGLRAALAQAQAQLAGQQAQLSQAQAQLAEQQDFYETVLNHLKVDVVVFDAEQRYRAVNAQAIADPELRRWLVGKTNYDYCTHRQKPRELAERRQQHFQQALHSRAEVSWEETLDAPDGPRQLVRHYIPVFGADGRPRLVVGTGTNITERRQAEQELRQQRAFYEYALNHIPHDIAIFDPQFRYLFVNTSGFSDPARRAWIIGRDDVEYCAYYGRPLERALTRQKHMRRAVRERQAVSFEEVFERPEGPCHQFRCLQPVFHADGSLHLIVGYSLDITERVATEQALRRATLTAEAIVRARETFLAHMSHEIRTPMNAILGMSQLLAKTPLAPEQDDYRQAIATSAEHLLVIINDILDLSKLEAGKMTLETVGFEPRRLLAEIEQTLHYQAAEKGLHLHVAVGASVPPVLRGDPHRLRQVLLNLAGNALKFTEQGQVEVSCTVVAGELRFRVADTGIGIAPEFARQLFGEYSQQDASVTRRFGGTGLGLSISRNLLRLMGSDVRLASEPQQGTVMEFGLRLPAGTAHDLPAALPLPAASAPGTPATRPDLRGKRVLLVEDNAFSRRIASTFLAHAQVLVTEAENGALAVEAARHARFDLILMDVQLPVLDGYAATARLRQQLGLTTPIVALTANALSGEREKCLAAGMNGYLTKPFKEAELLQAVSQWVLPPATPPAEAAPPTKAPPAKPAPAAANPAAAPTRLASVMAGAALAPAGPPAAAEGPLYATDELLHVGQGDLEFVTFMLRTFVESCEEAVADLDRGLAERRLDVLKTAAHTLRPSLTHLRAWPLLPSVEALDKWAGGFEAVALRPLVAEVRRGLLAVIARINLDLAQEPTAGE